MIELFPWDAAEHEHAAQFAPDVDRNLLTAAWVARSEGKVLGVTGIQQRWDIPMFRSIDPRATFKMADRLNTYLADRGFRGHDVFLFLSQSESPEQQCPARDRILAVMGARPAHRFVMTISPNRETSE